MLTDKDETKAGLLADLRAKRDRYCATSGKYDLAYVLMALDAFLDAPAPSQPTPEAHVELEALRCPHDPGADDFHTCASCVREGLARRSAPTGQQQEAGAAPPAAPKHEEWCALYGDPEKGESCDCAAAPPSAPQEGLFKEGWEAGREAAARVFDERAEALQARIPAYAHYEDRETLRGDVVRARADAARIRALPLPESALLTKAAPRNETYTEYVKRTTAAPAPVETREPPTKEKT